VATTRHAGIKDVLIQGEADLLVDEGNVNEMAPQVIRLAADFTLAEQLGSTARKRICAEFSMEKSIDNLWRIIEAAIHQPSNS